MGDGAPRLDGVEFAVLALGDTAYVEFCAIGKAIDARLEALGAKRVTERADLDLDFAEPAARWIDGAVTALAPAAEQAAGPTVGQVIAVDFGAAAGAQSRPGRGRGDRAYRSQLVALRQGDDPSRARLRRQGAGL